MDSCSICGKVGKIEKHHLCYKKNKTIKVCTGCHGKIHSKNKYNELKPIDGPEYLLIQIPMKTRDKLKKLWTHADDTYESVLEKLIASFETKKGR